MLFAMPEHIRRCRECGQRFTSTAHNALYCPEHATPAARQRRSRAKLQEQREAAQARDERIALGETPIYNEHGQVIGWDDGLAGSPGTLAPQG